jgi:hypothetical protein
MATFQDYVKNASQLMKLVKNGAKGLKGATSPSALMATVANEYLKPVFDLMKKVKTYIP